MPRWPTGLLAAAVAVFAFYYVDTYFRGVVPDVVHDTVTTWLPLLAVNEALIYVLAALGLNIVVGYAGLLDLGFVAFWAIGGYTAGWLMSGFLHGVNVRFFGSQFAADNNVPGVHLNFWTVLIVGALVSALAGALIGAPTLRLRSDYLALVTLGFGEIIYEVFRNGDNIFGVNVSNGSQGITPVDPVRFLGFDTTGALTVKDLGPFDGLSRFVIFVGLAALVLWASTRIRDGRLGRAWLAIREDELAANAMGVPLMRTKLSAYALGAVAGGIAGAAFAVHVSGVLPDRFRFDISITLLAMVVFGGMGNVWGVTLGALLLAWTNSTGLPRVQSLLVTSGAGADVGLLLLGVGVCLAAIGIWLAWARVTAGTLLIYLSVLPAVIGVVLMVGRANVSFQFLVFGSVLILMMLFRREGLIPGARTRLVLHEAAASERTRS